MNLLRDGARQRVPSAPSLQNEEIADCDLVAALEPRDRLRRIESSPGIQPWLRKCRPSCLIAMAMCLSTPFLVSPSRRAGISPSFPGPVLEKQIGKEVEGIMRETGINWRFGVADLAREIS
ncbi:hypothetical protein WBP07_22390 (plasmid) [Novosphingobium sp. BL-8A]|uniref:hypothetical protein n=1 Tax=Novosphingobium sp. BL-8A TaxID=3127639 RepID=UPI0037568116